MRFFLLLMASAVMPVLPLDGAVAAATNKAGPALGAIGEQMRDLAGTGARGELAAPGGLGTFVETILVLALFIAGIYGVFRFIQRKRNLGGVGEDAIRLLANRSAGGSRAVQVIEVGRRVFVIGVGDSAINLIAEIEDAEALENLRLDYARESAKGGESFFDRLVHLLGRSGSSDRGQLSREKLEYLRTQKERLARLKKEQ